MIMQDSAAGPWGLQQQGMHRQSLSSSGDSQGADAPLQRVASGAPPDFSARTHPAPASRSAAQQEGQPAAAAEVAVAAPAGWQAYSEPHVAPDITALAAAAAAAAAGQWPAAAGSQLHDDSSAAGPREHSSSQAQLADDCSTGGGAGAAAATSPGGKRRGGRRHAPDPLLDPSIPEKKARRILANRCVAV